MNKELQEAIAIAKEADALTNIGQIYSIEAGRVQLSQEYFEANLSGERALHSQDYDQIVAHIDGVRVFCLVEIEKPEAPIAHQSV